jgi:glycosyltransferase involved in cell wall biosynthesis
MKIALLHYTAPPIVGGVESVLAHHAHLMAKAGHQVTIYAGRGKPSDGRIRMQIFPRLDSRNPQVLQLKAQLDQGRYTHDFDQLRDEIKADIEDEIKDQDILIAHNVASLHKNLALTAALKELNDRPAFPRLILWHHDLAWTAPRYRRELHDGYPWDLLRSPWPGARQVVVSEFRRQQLSKLTGIAQTSIRVITNGVDLNSFFKFEPLTIQLIERLNLIQADPLFLLPVRLTPRKNIELALRIMVELQNEFPEAVLLVTGPEGPHNPGNAAYKRKLLDLRKEWGLEDRVVFLVEVSQDFIPDNVIIDFYRLADAIILPSREEGFGIPLIEAAFSSIPVFCAKIPALRELGGQDVSYFNLDANPSAIARDIISRLKSEATSRWSRRAKHAYTWDSIYITQIAPLLEQPKT